MGRGEGDEVKERPILFSAPMVRAILAGQKTQTRQLGRFDPEGAEMVRLGRWEPTPTSFPKCPYGAPGDRLWVRETWAAGVPGCPGGLSYRADHQDPHGDGPANPMRWRPSIHMKRNVSRIALEIMTVHAERLLAIGEADAKAEGARPFFETFPSFHHDQRITTGERAADAPHRAGFAVLWDEINGDRALWISNPWVWVVTFKQVE